MRTIHSGINIFRLYGLDVDVDVDVDDDDGNDKDERCVRRRKVLTCFEMKRQKKACSTTPTD